VLGVGGMGATRHTGQGSEVALKMLQPSADSRADPRHVQGGGEVALKMLQPSAVRDGESVGRFLREGRAASVLRSPPALRPALRAALGRGLYQPSVVKAGHPLAPGQGGEEKEQRPAR
jgi:hypothetical protein